MKPEAVIAFFGVQWIQLDHIFDKLREPNSGDPKQILDVDDADPPQLHVVAGQFRAGPDQRLVTPFDFDHVVGDEAVAAGDEVEGTFAFPDAAIPDQ